MGHRSILVENQVVCIYRTTEGSPKKVRIKVAYTELRKDLPKRLGSKVRISGWNIPSIYPIYKIYDGETTYYHWNPTSPMDPKKNPTWTSIYVCQIFHQSNPPWPWICFYTPGVSCNHHGVRSQKRFFSVRRDPTAAGHLHPRKRTNVP